jgi:hypothetical protein
MTLSLTYLIYKNYAHIELCCLGPHALAFWSLLQDGPSPYGPLLQPSKFMRLGTLGTDSRQQPPSAWLGNSHLVILSPPCDE